MMQLLHSAAEDYPGYLLQRNTPWQQELFATVQILLVSSSLKAVLKESAGAPSDGQVPGAV